MTTQTTYIPIDFLQIPETHNLYIIRAYGKYRTMIKFGYSSKLIDRLKTHCHSNPLTELVGTYYRDDAKLFERWFHSNHKSITLDEWYNEDILQIIITKINSAPIVTTSPKYSASIDSNIVNTVLYTFYNKNGPIESNITIKQMATKYNIPVQRLFYVTIGVTNHSHGWTISENIKNKINQQNRKLQGNYTFFHEDGEIIENVTVDEFCLKYNFKLAGITRKIKNEGYKGWSLIKYPKYNFINKHTKEIVMNCTPHNLYKTYSASLFRINNMLNNKCKSADGWILLQPQQQK